MEDLNALTVAEKYQLAREAIQTLIEENQKGNPEPGRAQITVIAEYDPGSMVVYLCRGIAFRMRQRGDEEGEQMLNGLIRDGKGANLTTCREVLRQVVSLGREVVKAGEEDDAIRFLLNGILVALRGMESQGQNPPFHFKEEVFPTSPKHKDRPEIH